MEMNKDYDGGRLSASKGNHGVAEVFLVKKVGDFNKMEFESLIFTGLEIQREYLYETGVHIEKNKLGNTWWQKQAHVSYARMCVMDTYASV